MKVYRVGREMRKNIVRKILYTGYIEFFLSIWFWIGAGISMFEGISSWVYVVMFGFLMCSLFIIFTALIYDKFYQDIKKSFEDLEKLNSRLRSQRHEYLNEMQVVYGLLELEEYEEAVKYLRPVYADIAKVGKALKTSKPAVNALLSSKMEKAEKQEIQLFVEVSSDLSKISMEQWDICKILGNIIDNAITAVSNNANSKEVHIHISEQPNWYIFSIYNNGPVIAENKRELIFKQGYSSKKESGHGFGLAIVKEIVTEHGGSIELSSGEKKTEFEIKIPKVL